METVITSIVWLVFITVGLACGCSLISSNISEFKKVKESSDQGVLQNESYEVAS